MPNITDMALQGLRDNDYTTGMIKSRLEQERQLEDMKRRRSLEQEVPGFTSGATPFDIQSAEENLAESPNFGLEPQRQLATFGRAQQAAQLAGYPTPQKQAEAQAAAEREKTTMPLQVAKTQQQGAMDIEREQQRGAMQRAMQQEFMQRGLKQMEAESPQQQYYKELMKTLGTDGGPGNIKSISKTGVTFQTPSAAINQQTLNQIAAARAAVQKASGMWGADPTAAQTRLSQLVAGAVANHPASQEDKILARQISEDPRTAGMSADELVQRMQRKGALDPNRVSSIRELLAIIKGE